MAEVFFGMCLAGSIDKGGFGGFIGVHLLLIILVNVRLWYLFIGYFWCTHDDGCNGVFPTCTQIALG